MSRMMQIYLNIKYAQIHPSKHLHSNNYSFSQIPSLLEICDQQTILKLSSFSATDRGNSVETQFLCNRYLSKMIEVGLSDRVNHYLGLPQILEQISQLFYLMRPLKREQSKYGVSDRAYLNSPEQVYEYPKAEYHSSPFNLPRIESSLPSIVSSPQDGMNRLQNYVHKLLAQQHEDVLRIRRMKRAKKEEQARRDYLKQKEQLQKQKERLYMLHLQEQLRLLKKEQRAEEIKLAHELSFIENYRNQYKSNVCQLRQTQPDDSVLKRAIKSQRPKKHTQVELKPQPKKINYKRKFRIIGYVVYFALAFKKYASVFRQIRQEYFYQHVVAEKLVEKQTKNLLFALNSIKPNKYISPQRKEDSLKGETFTFTEIDERGMEYQMEVSLGGIAKSVIQLLKQVKQLIKGESLNNLFQVVAFHLMRQSFLSDNLFLLDQLYRLRVSLGQKELLMNKQFEVYLLINFIIAKITCFKFMLSPNTTENKAKGKQQSRREKILLIGGLYLFNKCNEVTSSLVNDAQLKKDGNIEQLDKTGLPKPMQPLQISDQYNFDLGQSQEKRMSIQQNIQFSYLNNPGIKYKNMEKAEEFAKIITQRSTIQKQVSEAISEIGWVIHQKCFVARKKHFEFLRKTAIQHTYYLTRQIPVYEVSLKRIPNQIKTSQQHINLFLKARADAKKQSIRAVKVMSLKGLKQSKEKLASRQNIYVSGSTSSAPISKELLSQRQSEKQTERQSLSQSIQNTSRNSDLSDISRHKGSKSHEYLSVNKQNQPKLRRQGGKLNVDYKKKQLTKIDEVSENKD